MFGLVSKKKYDEVKKSNELLRSAVINLEKALRNERIANEIVKTEHEAAVNELFNYSGSLVKMYDENKETLKENELYKEAAEKIADIVLSLPWNNINTNDCPEYDTITNYQELSPIIYGADLDGD